MAFENPRALASRVPEQSGLMEWVTHQLIPAFLSLRSLFATMSNAFNTGAIPFGPITVRVVTGVPVDADPNGSIAFRIDGGAGTTMYHREAGVWVGRA